MENNDKMKIDEIGSWVIGISIFLILAIFIYVGFNYNNAKNLAESKCEDKDMDLYDWVYGPSSIIIFVTCFDSDNGNTKMFKVKRK